MHTHTQSLAAKSEMNERMLCMEQTTAYHLTSGNITALNYASITNITSKQNGITVNFSDDYD